LLTGLRALVAPVPLTVEKLHSVAPVFALSA